MKHRLDTYKLINSERAIVPSVAEPETGIVALSYSARDLVSCDGAKPEWRDVCLSRDKFRELILNSPYSDRMVPSTVLWDWVQDNTAPDFLRTGDHFITTLLEDPITSMWCLHGKIFISSVGQLPGHVEISKKLEFVLAYA